MGGDDGREVSELLRLQCEKLVAGLCRLQRACRALALPDQRRHLRPVGVDVADDAGLDTHRILQAADGVLPALARTGDELLVRGGHRRIAVGRSERLVDVLDVVGDSLPLAQKLLRPLGGPRTEEHTSELPSLMRSSYAV